MSFAERIKVGRAFEDQVVERLLEHGWIADHFGQAFIPERQRKMWHRAKLQTNARWMPDIIAHKCTKNRVLFAFFDAKKCDLSFSNRLIETMSLNSMIAWKVFCGIETWVVTSDWCVHTLDAIERESWDGPQSTNGSGTPYRLWPATFGRPWDQFMQTINDELIGGNCA